MTIQSFFNYQFNNKNDKDDFFVNSTNLNAYNLLTNNHFDQNIFLFGQKKSGKSELVLSKAISGNLIYADDLLLWNPKKGVFISLGLPLRIRKSSPLLSDHTLIKDKFLIGKNILYSHQKYFNNAKFGVSFSLDRLKTVDKNFKTKNVPIHKILTYLEQHLISDNFTSYKKDL